MVQGLGLLGVSHLAGVVQCSRPACSSRAGCNRAAKAVVGAAAGEAGVAMVVGVVVLVVLQG